MEKRATLLSVINLILTAVLVVFVAVMWLKSNGPGAPDPDRFRGRAALFEGKGLYAEAVAAYDELLAEAPLTAEAESKIHFQKAELLYEKLGNCQAALPAYLLSKQLNPQAKYAGEADKKSMTCLERLGKSLDAQNMLEQITALEPAQDQDAGAVIATIDGREIFLRDLNDSIQDLPPELQQKLSGSDGKKQYLMTYLLEQMLYDKAVREGMDASPEFTHKMDRLRKGMLSQMAYRVEMADKIKISPEAVSQYYQEHQDEFKDDQGQTIPIDQVARQIAETLVMQQENEAGEQLLEQMMKLHEVKIYEDALKTE